MGLKMIDKELANKCVASGVGGNYRDLYYPPTAVYPKDVEGFVCDWLVAGAMMERISNRSIITYFGNDGWDVRVVYYTGSPTHEVIVGESRSGNSLPRAIIEARVEALSDD